MEVFKHLLLVLVGLSLDNSYMPEIIPSSNLESEIEELSKQIELKRTQLETESGIIDEKEVVRDVVQETYVAPQAIAAVQSITPLQDDTVPEPKSSEIDSKVEGAISIFEEEGIEKAVKNIKDEHPLVIDRFHDKLVDELYEKLREKGIVK